MTMWLLEELKMQRIARRKSPQLQNAVIEAIESRCMLSGSPAIALENLDVLPSNTQLAFNRIQNPNPAVNDIVHDTDTLRIHNNGTSALVINSLTLSDTTNWQLVNPPAAGVSIAPGGTRDVTVKFIAQSVPPNQPANETNDVISTDNLPPSQTGGVWNGTLTINSNDPNQSTEIVQLAGYWQLESEHEEEPNLQTIVNQVFGYGTVIDNTQQPQYPNNGSVPVLYGEEVASPYWQAADPSQPVSVRQIAAYHNQQDLNNGQSPTPAISWFAQGSGTSNLIFKQLANNSQAILPYLANANGTPAAGTFTPSGAFGWNLDGESSVNSQNTADITGFGRSGHSVRFFPLRDSSGNLVPNTWIVAMDYQNGSFDNSDFQDNVYLVSNIHPATQAAAVTNLSASQSGGQVALQWTPVSDGTLSGYNVYRSSTPSGTFTKLNTSPIGTASFVDTSPGTGAEYYLVSAVNSAGESLKAAVSVNTPATSSFNPSLAGDLGTLVKGHRTIAGSVTLSATEAIYSFTLSATSNVSTRLFKLQDDANLQLLDVNGNVLRTSSHKKKNPESFTVNKLAPGTYYLRIFLSNLATVGTSFNLTVTDQPVPVPKPKPTHKASPELLTSAVSMAGKPFAG
jgi:hypothetical protein